jgi:hypothetical protein
MIKKKCVILISFLIFLSFFLYKAQLNQPMLAIRLLFRVPFTFG